MIHIEKTQDNVFVFWEPSSNWDTQGTFNGTASASRTRRSIADRKQGNKNNEPAKHLSQRSAR